MGNTCGTCMCFDRKQSQKQMMLTYYWCTRFNCWRRENQGACGAYVYTGGCFLTSACVTHKGLADDCEELTVLRAFRDGYLKNTVEGSKLIKEYYEIAPELVNRIDNSKHMSEIYDYIYERICECVELVKSNEFERATEEYKKMTLKVKGMV